MDTLESYLSIISPHLLNHITGKPGEFVRIFQEEKYISKQVFMRRICGEKHSREYYDNLKSRTLKILQALAIISTINGGSTIKKKFDICQKKMTIGQKFLNQGRKNDRIEGIKLVRKAYHLAVDYNFVHLACECASILYHHHVYYQKNTHLANRYAKQVDAYLNAYGAEKKAEHYYYQFAIQMGKAIKAEELQKTVTQISSLNGTSIKYMVYEASIKTTYGLYIGDYKYVANSCRKALQFFEGKKGVYSSHYCSFLVTLGMAQMAIRNYLKAEDSLQKAAKYASHRSRNDYAVRFYRTLNALHMGQYETAYTLYRKNRSCKFEAVQQQFAIVEAYLCFLGHTGYFQLDKPFRLGKYLNDTFKAQANKRGDNINILIAELLVYLARDKGKFIDRVEAIKNYSYRYLKDKDTQRAKWFIQILCTLPRANFHPIALKRLAKKQIENLNQSNIRMGENFAIEIIPFENLLDMIMAHLERKVA